jgi:hypothetical protein
MSKEKATAFLKGIEHGGESVRLEELTAEVEEQRKIIDRLEKELEEYRHSRWWQFWR